MCARPADLLALGISYEIRYVEENQRGGKRNLWSLRHTGIYHRHTLDFDLFIILHPMKGSVLEKRIQQLENDTVSDRMERMQLCNDPFRLHSMLFASYFDNWRWYFRYLADQFPENVSIPCPPP